jgi:protein farnesyltransferase/geranylgeranyltransferase type-1 subunit alpha
MESPDPTISAKLEAEYLSSRPYLALAETKGLSNLTANEKAAYANSRFLETGAWRTWAEPQQKEFWKAVESQKIPTPLPKPRELGKDSRGRELGSYTPEEYKAHVRREEELRGLREKSWRFGEKWKQGRVEETTEELVEERNRRGVIGLLQGKKMGKYEGDPVWDDVVPIPQDDGKGALAAIAYTDEYAEGKPHISRFANLDMADVE